MTAIIARAAGEAGLLSPRAAAWSTAAEAKLDLVPTPLDAQPSAYVRVSWAGREYGRTAAVAVKALTRAGRLYVRLQWEASDVRAAITDNNVYADACALLFPADGKDAAIATMGAPGKGVAGWYWRAGAPGPFSVTAEGLGTVTRAKEHSIEASAEYQGGSWQVVLSGPAGAVKVGVAIWKGSASERAGLKAHTPAWHDLKSG